MPKSYEEISNYNASSQGKTDANLANDSLHLGGIPAEEYATEKYVQDYHDNKEASLKKYIDQQDAAKLNEAKEYTNTMIRNQDFSDFAKDTDITALEQKLTQQIEACHTNCSNKIDGVVQDVNENFKTVTDAIEELNGTTDELFQSVSNGKKKIAEAITDKGVSTSATDTFGEMASNIRKIETGGSSEPLVVIPDGYIDTSDANATPDKLLQGYTAYVNGNKIHGTLVPEGGSSTGGVILGNNEVVASEIYGEAGVLIGGECNVDPSISIVKNGGSNARIGFIHTAVYGDYIIADRKRTEGIKDEIVIYNLSSTNQIYHKDLTKKFSYTLSELEIEGTINCIAASPLNYWANIFQISIGTDVAIYNFLFDVRGNNENGAIGVTSPEGLSGDVWKKKIVINNPSRDYGSICYSNTDPSTIAYFVGTLTSGKVYIQKLSWFLDSGSDLLYADIGSSWGNNVMSSFRFSKNDRFLICTPYYGTACLILLDHFRFVTSGNFNDGSRCSQMLINSEENFAIFNGKPHKVEYDIIEKTINLIKMSDTKVVPFDGSNNEYNYGFFSRNDKYVISPKLGYQYLNCYKVDLLNLDAEWQIVSSELPITENGAMPTFDILNSRVLAHDSTNGIFYYYYPNPNEKDLIGLSYNGKTYYG